MKTMTMELTPDEVRVLTTYRTIAGGYQRNWILCGEALAATYPRHKVPALRVVAREPVAMPQLKQGRSALHLHLLSGGAR